MKKIWSRLILVFLAFVLSACNLTVVNSGGGTVNSASGAIQCGEKCVLDVKTGVSTETLTAVADPGYKFMGWSGSGCSGEDACIIQIGQSTGNKKVVATFALIDNQSKISYVTPSVVYQDVIGDDYLILRGEGFSNSNGNIVFGDSLAISTEVISDTEIHVVPPKLANGKYDIHFQNSILNSLAPTLLVRGAPNFSNAYVPLQTESVPVGPTIFNAEHNIFYTQYCLQNPYCEQSDYRLFAFYYNETNNAWVTKVLNFYSPFDMQLTPDGVNLVVCTGSQLLFLNPVTLVTNKVVNIPGGQSGYGDFYEMAVMNNGKILLQYANSIYDLTSGEFTQLPAGTDLGNSGFVSAGDKSKALFSYAVVSSPSEPRYVKQFDSANNTVSDTSFLKDWYASNAPWDFRGKKLFYINGVYDQNFNLIGTAPQVWPTTISNKGDKLLQIDGGSPYVVNILDVANLPPFPVILSFPLNSFGKGGFGPSDKFFYISAYNGLYVRSLN